MSWIVLSGSVRICPVLLGMLLHLSGNRTSMIARLERIERILSGASFIQINFNVGNSLVRGVKYIRFWNKIWYGIVLENNDRFLEWRLTFFWQRKSPCKGNLVFLSVNVSANSDRDCLESLLSIFRLDKFTADFTKPIKPMQFLNSLNLNQRKALYISILWLN